MRSLTSLAEEALSNAKKLDEYVLSQGREHTSFKNDTLFELPPDMIRAKQALVNSAQTLKQLALRPEGVLAEIMWASTDQVSLGAINHFRLADQVPLTGSISFEDIANGSGRPEALVKRLMSHAMGNHMFTENEPGKVQHTASSKLLVTDSHLRDTIFMAASDMWEVSTKVVEAVKLHHDCQEPNEAAFTLANEPGVPFFAFLEKQPERARRFGRAMEYFARPESFSLKHLVNAYPWASLDHSGAVFVDVGGGQGWVSRALVDSTKNIKFLVQDFAGTIEEGRKTLPQDIKHRVVFMQHDFFKEQPVKSADVYFLRWILHDWSDKYALEILRSLVPALKAGARIMVYEQILVDGPETRLTEKMGRNADLAMLAQFNGQERSASDFRTLFRKADQGFHLTGFYRAPGSAMTVVDVVWRPNA